MASAVIEWIAHSMEERSHWMFVKGEEVQCVSELKHINTHKSLWDYAMWRKDAFFGTSYPYLLQHKDQIISKISAVTVWDLRHLLPRIDWVGLMCDSHRIIWNNAKVRER